MTTCRQQQALLAAIRAEPYDPAARLVYADWLEEQGREQEARQQRWMAGAVRGQVPSPFPLAVLTRRGVTVEDTYEEVIPQGVRPSLRVTKSVIQGRNYWLRRAQELFDAHPDVLFLVVSDAAPTHQGFRYERPSDGRFRSPILFYRRSDNWGHSRSSKVSRVVV